MEYFERNISYRLEIYRIVSQRQIQDPVGPPGMGGNNSPVPLRLPPTDSDFKSKSNNPSCCP